MSILKPGELGPMGPEIQRLSGELLSAFMRQYPGLAEAAWKGTTIKLELSNGVVVSVPQLRGRAVDPSNMPKAPGAGLFGANGQRIPPAGG